MWPWELILEVVLAIAIPSIASFVVACYLWNIDAQCEKSYKGYYGIVGESGEFPRLGGPSPENVIVTSSLTSASRLRGAIKTVYGKAKRLEVEVIPLREEDTRVRREIELIRKVVSQVPGGHLLEQNLLCCLRNYLAYKCAIRKEPCISEVVEFFQHEFEKEITWSVRLKVLDNPNHFDDVVPLRRSRAEVGHRSVLNEVLLPVVSCIDRNRFGFMSVSSHVEEIEKAKGMLTKMAYGLYATKVLAGFIADDEISLYHNSLTNDVKDMNRWGYILMDDRLHFRKFQSCGIFLEEKLKYYWGDNFDCETPSNAKIGDIAYVDGVFIYFVKHKEAFRKRGKDTRIKGEQKYRKKEGFE